MIVQEKKEEKNNNLSFEHFMIPCDKVETWNSQVSKAENKHIALIFFSLHIIKGDNLNVF